MGLLKKVDGLFKNNFVTRGFLGLHAENNHANARLAYIAYLNRRNSTSLGVREEAAACLRQVNLLGGLSESDIEMIKRELSVPLAWR